jgi:hypothetical protein
MSNDNPNRPAPSDTSHGPGVYPSARKSLFYIWKVKAIRQDTGTLAQWIVLALDSQQAADQVTKSFDVNIHTMTVEETKISLIDGPKIIIYPPEAQE